MKRVRAAERQLTPTYALRRSGAHTVNETALASLSLPYHRVASKVSSPSCGSCRVGRCKLSFSFQTSWRFDSETRSMTLALGATDIATVRPQREGWVVEVLLISLLGDDPAKVAVPSPLRGRYWADRWAHEHATQIAGTSLGVTSYVPSTRKTPSNARLVGRRSTGADLHGIAYTANSRMNSTFGCPLSAENMLAASRRER